MWVARRTFEVGEYLVGIRTNSEDFAEWMGEALGKYASDVETEGYYSVILGSAVSGRLGRPYHALYADSATVLRTFDVSALARALFVEMEMFLRPYQTDLLYADMGLVSADGVTALIPNTLLPYLAMLGRGVQKAGLTTPRDRQVAIDPESGNVVPLPPLLDVPKESLADLDEVTPEEGGDSRSVVERPTKVDFVVSHGMADDLLQEVSPAQALYRLASNTRNMRRLGSRGVDGLQSVVAGARAVEIQAKTPKGALDALLTALRGA